MERPTKAAAHRPGLRSAVTHIVADWNQLTMGRGAGVGMIDSRPQSAYNKLVGKGVVHVF